MKTARMPSFVGEWVFLPIRPAFRSAAGPSYLVPLHNTASATALRPNLQGSAATVQEEPVAGRAPTCQCVQGWHGVQDPVV